MDEVRSRDRARRNKKKEKEKENAEVHQRNVQAAEVGRRCKQCFGDGLQLVSREVAAGKKRRDEKLWWKERVKRAPRAAAAGTHSSTSKVVRAKTSFGNVLRPQPSRLLEATGDGWASGSERLGGGVPAGGSLDQRPHMRSRFVLPLKSCDGIVSSVFSPRSLERARGRMKTRHNEPVGHVPVTALPCLVREARHAHDPQLGQRLKGLGGNAGNVVASQVAAREGNRAR